VHRQVPGRLPARSGRPLGGRRPVHGRHVVRRALPAFRTHSGSGGSRRSLRAGPQPFPEQPVCRPRRQGDRRRQKSRCRRFIGPGGTAGGRTPVSERRVLLRGVAQLAPETENQKQLDRVHRQVRRPAPALAHRPKGGRRPVHERQALRRTPPMVSKPRRPPAGQRSTAAGHDPLPAERVRRQGAGGPAAHQRHAGRRGPERRQRPGDGGRSDPERRYGPDYRSAVLVQPAIHPPRDRHRPGDGLRLQPAEKRSCRRQTAAALRGPAQQPVGTGPRQDHSDQRRSAHARPRRAVQPRFGARGGRYQVPRRLRGIFPQGTLPYRHGPQRRRESIHWDVAATARWRK
jgi:hypothetical protein